MMTDSLRGRMLWYELMTTDMAAATDFYTTIVGWKTTPFDGAGMPYQMWLREGEEVPIGGLMNIPPGMNFPPHWMMYVGVPALEDATSQIERLGGSTLSPVIDIPEVGRMRAMRDPQGAAFSIYQPASPPKRAEAPPELGEISWHELLTTDAPAAMTFYGELFGWTPDEAMDMGEMGKYHMYSRPAVGMLGGMFNRSAEMAEVPPNWLLYFQVSDIQACTERIKAHGGTILNGPMEVPGGDWIVQATDPQGAAFGLHSKKA